MDYVECARTTFGTNLAMISRHRSQRAPPPPTGNPHVNPGDIWNRIDPDSADDLRSWYFLPDLLYIKEGWTRLIWYEELGCTRLVLAKSTTVPVGTGTADV